MRTIKYWKAEAMPRLIYILFLVVALVSTSCEKEDAKKGSFELIDAPSKLEVKAQGGTSTYTFKANGSWKIESVPKDAWIKISPREGNGDGTFTVVVAKNYTSEIRSTTLIFSVDGQLQNNTLKIEQAGAIAGEQEGDSYLHFDGHPSNLEIVEGGGTTNYIVRSTGRWRLELEDQPDWLSIEPMEGNGDTPIDIIVSKNTYIERYAQLLFFLDDVQQPNAFAIHQKGQKLQVSGDVVLKEDFNWLNYGSEIFNVTDGETRIGSWNATDIAKGWTSTINTTEGGGSYASIYARPGFVKLGRTSYGGDLISPKLENVQRTKDLVVTFKAVRYATGDHYLLTVGVKGPGTVSVKQFDVMNVANPNSNLEACRAAWKAPEATYSFVVTGATSETQVWFLGGAFDQRAGNWPKTTNRIFIDDVVVTVK
ncbi:MAG: hypothetical protein LBE37_08010 [Sphingobacterium sp.]|nr:hypothetical protein [Sphingobacterium sp.]